jgi:hypothetical protein
MKLIKIKVSEKQLDFIQIVKQEKKTNKQKIVNLNIQVREAVVNNTCFPFFTSNRIFI